MNRRRLIRISLIVTLLLCIFLYTQHFIRYANQFETMTRDILSNSHSWQELLVEAVAEKSISAEHTMELLSESSRFVHTIEYEFEYSGIYLVTNWMFPSKEGLLISTLNIESIPLSSNTGKEIELLGSADGIFVYRLHYYWD